MIKHDLTDLFAKYQLCAICAIFTHYHCKTNSTVSLTLAELSKENMNVVSIKNPVLKIILQVWQITIFMKQQPLRNLINI